ncbi:hypothetical protein NV377_05090 [Paenibacillus sp. T3-5-0-4]|nr:hypothetical protein [Paenibacillus endoradicis]
MDKYSCCANIKLYPKVERMNLQQFPIIPRINKKWLLEIVSDYSVGDNYAVFSQTIGGD